MHVSKITSKGQTTLPVELREELGLVPGDRIEYIRQPDGSYRIIKHMASFADLKGILNIGRPVSSDEIAEAVDAARAAIGRGESDGRD